MQNAEEKVISVWIVPSRQQKHKKQTLIKGIPTEQQQNTLRVLKKEMSCVGAIRQEDGGTIELNGNFSYSIENILKNYFSEYSVNGCYKGEGVNGVNVYECELEGVNVYDNKISELKGVIDISSQLEGVYKSIYN
ncbi:hypothetical protein CWI39_1871p0020 [Hamiltosporidium magnivora]|uniref:SUI1 domain-containing protein n=1 Tax=Hamiltosporidium magnivora TaxID=148818 RepID=A0A4Q9KY30_9MICR|nr:hypothetical protein CWI39_1871p0020 [Hamiltosporidium magnivora]